MGIGNGTSRVIVEMTLDIRANHAPEGPNDLEHLPGRRYTDRIGNTHSVYAHPVNRLVERKKVDEIGPEGILGREADLTTLATLRSVIL